MSYNGSGTFLINTAGQPVVSGTVISSTAFNALTADLATGLSTAITKDGQTTVTANIPMSTYKFTGLGAGSGAADSANLSQVQSTVVKLLASVSGTDTITAVGSPTVAAYAAGQMFYFVAAGDNTGAVTINIDSLGAKNVTRDGSVALAAGDIKSGEVVVIVYDGTRFQVVSQLNSSGDARFANVSIASALNVGGVATVTGGAVLNGGVVINEPGADVDFRVEGDTDANLIFADASADKVGIGTSSPSEKLEVLGNIKSSSSSGTTFVQVNDTSTGGKAYTLISAGAGNVHSVAAGSFYIRDSSAGATRVVLDGSGNLGLGVTPSAWSTVVPAFQLGGAGTFLAAQGNSTPAVYLGTNAHYNGTNWIYKVSNAATRYDQDTGVHRWFNAASGTAGNTISFTQAMTLDASGRLGIGTTSPTEKLEVAAAGKIQVLRSDNARGGQLFADGTGTHLVALAAGNDPLYLEALGNSGDIRFTTSSSERARITSGGSLLLGSTSNNGKLYVEQSSEANTGKFSDTNASTTSDGILIALASRNTTNNTFYALGYYNTGAGAYRWRVADSGNVTNTNGSYGTISDVKMKTDIVDAGSQWADIKGLRFRKFKMKDDPSGITQLGVVAQEVEQVSPGLVEEHADFEEVEVTDDEGNVKKERQPTGTTTKSVKTSVLLMKAAVALQEAMARIEKLEAEVAALKGA